MDLSLPLAHYRIKLCATTAITFNGYSGSAWRGLFGHALRKTACVTQERDCKRCLLYHNCVYSYIFETPPPENTRYMRRYTAAPHPFVLTPDLDLRGLQPEQTTELDLVLVGKAIQHFPYIVHALGRAGQFGIGPSQGNYAIQEITQETSPGSGCYQPIYIDGQLNALPAATPAIPALPEKVTLRIESPIRLKYDSRIMTPSKFQFAGLIVNLLRRVSMLSYFHNDTELDLDYKSLTDKARQLTPISLKLAPYHWSRFSSRQHAKIKMDGFTGVIEVSGEEIAPFWPLLYLGQWLHLGKGTSMGMGGYRIESDNAVQAATEAA